MTDYLDENNMLCPEQSGFRKKHRTSDHMFILKNIMQKYKHDNKPLYIAFIDFKQAFDTIRHQDLFYKLLCNGVSHKFYNIIKSMYNNISLAVQSTDRDRISTYFVSLLGVRQGNTLSPTLFNIFVNDLPKIYQWHMWSNYSWWYIYKLYAVCRWSSNIISDQFRFTRIYE